MFILRSIPTPALTLMFENKYYFLEMDHISSKSVLQTPHFLNIIPHSYVCSEKIIYLLKAFPRTAYS